MRNHTQRAAGRRRGSELGHDERGTSSTEFTILVAIITVICLTGWKYMGRVIVAILIGD